MEIEFYQKLLKVCRDAQAMLSDTETILKMNQEEVGKILDWYCKLYDLQKDVQDYLITKGWQIHNVRTCEFYPGTERMD